MNVFGLNHEFADLDAALESNDGELTPELEAQLQRLVNETPAALEQAGFWRQAVQARIEVAKKRRSALAASIEKSEAFLDRLDAQLLPILKSLGKPAKFAEFTLSTLNRTSYHFAVSVDADIFTLDSSFVRYKEPELNKTALTDAYKAGQLPEGVTCVETPSTSVTLRVPKKKDAISEEAA